MGFAWHNEREHCRQSIPEEDSIVKRNIRILAILMAGLFTTSGVALAEKPSWAGGGKHGNKEDRGDDRRDERRYDDRGQVSVGVYFQDDSRRILGDYYGTQARAGKCPPGLAKKGNGCMPPGQARKWAKGRPLPADLRYYDLPHDLLVRLPPPPPRHRYVQIAGDVLLIAIGTSMVVDAVEDIMR
jgi:Ni/Co efflux regulator RcnB